MKDKAGKARAKMPTATLRPVEKKDCDILYSWQTEEARRYFEEPHVPELSEHRSWFNERIAKENPHLWIVECGAASAGYVRLDNNPGREGFDVSVLIDRNYQGRGIATLALKILRELMPSLYLWAEIHPENVGSRKAFKNAGFWDVSPCLMVNSSLTESPSDTEV